MELFLLFIIDIIWVNYDPLMTKLTNFLLIFQVLVFLILFYILGRFTYFFNLKLLRFWSIFRMIPVSQSTRILWNPALFIILTFRKTQTRQNIEWLFVMLLFMLKNTRKMKFVFFFFNFWYLQTSSRLIFFDRFPIKTL